MSYVPEEDEIVASRTPAGGWRKSTLAKWGVPWPPPRGWRKALAQMCEGGPPPRWYRS
jgi:hypothetical protein